MLHGRECGPLVHNSRRGPRCRPGDVIDDSVFQAKQGCCSTYVDQASVLYDRAPIQQRLSCRTRPPPTTRVTIHPKNCTDAPSSAKNAMSFTCMHMVITSCKYVMACVWVRSSNSHPCLQDQPDGSVRHAPGSCARVLRLRTASCKERQERCLQQRSQKEVGDKQKHGGTTTSRDIFLFQNKDPIARATPKKKRPELAPESAC